MKQVIIDNNGSDIKCHGDVDSKHLWLITDIITVKEETYAKNYEIMVLFVLILQTRMGSHPVGLDVWFLVGPYLMCANSKGSGETAQMGRLAWAFAVRLCDKYHTLMSWLKCLKL